MSNEELTNKYIELQAKIVQMETEKSVAFEKIAEIQGDVKETKKIVEDVHLIATNMATMQKTQDEMKETQKTMQKDMETLKNKEYRNYEENKKIIKDKIVSAGAGAIASALITAVIYVIQKFC